MARISNQHSEHASITKKLSQIKSGKFAATKQEIKTLEGRLALLSTYIGAKDE